MTRSIAAATGGRKAGFCHNSDCIELAVNTG
jgi:hypothetical protein